MNHAIESVIIFVEFGDTKKTSCYLSVKMLSWHVQDHKDLSKFKQKKIKNEKCFFPTPFGSMVLVCLILLLCNLKTFSFCITTFFVFFNQFHSLLLQHDWISTQRVELIIVEGIYSEYTQIRPKTSTSICLKNGSGVVAFFRDPDIQFW